MRRCWGEGQKGLVEGPNSGRFDAATAAANGSLTYLLAKIGTDINAPQVEGDMPPERPELPGLAVRWRAPSALSLPQGR